MSRATLKLALAIVLGTSVPLVPAHATTIFSATAGACDDQGSGGAACIDQNFTLAPVNGEGHGQSYANPLQGIGSVAVATGTVYDNTTAVPQGPQFASGAYIQLDDVIVSGPEGKISTSINLFAHYSEFTQFNAVSGTDLGQYSLTNASSDLNISGGDNDLSFFYNNHTTMTRKVNSSGQVFNIFDISGDFPDVTAQELLDGTLLQTPGFDVSVNTPITLTLSIGTFAQLTLSVPIGCPLCEEVTKPGASGGTTMNAVDTFYFPGNGPVFNLPAGYTANSASGLIVDNRWVSGAAAEVPEPGTLSLFCLGLLGAGAMRRRTGTCKG